MYRHTELEPKDILYLGLRLPQKLIDKAYHLPLIEIEPIDFHSKKSLFAKKQFSKATHIIITSQTTAFLLKKWLGHIPKHLQILAIGKKTKETLLKLNYSNIFIAPFAQAEGIIPLLEKISPQNSFIFYPHSANARPILSQFLNNNHYYHCDFSLYQTVTKQKCSPPPLHLFKKVYFTSPTTVDAFYAHYKTLPPHIEPICIGKITQNYLTNTLSSI